MGDTFEKWLLVLLINIVVQFTIVASFHSYVPSNTGNAKPILRSTRMETDDKNTTNKIAIENKELQWLKELREKIEKSVSENGYENAKPIIQKLVKETEESLNVLLFVKVARNGTTEIEYSPLMRAKKSKRSKKSKKGSGREGEPNWVSEFKDFIHKLVETYSKEKGKAIMEHFIKSLESKKQILIKDIDIDPFGNVIVVFDGNNDPENNKDVEN